MILGCVGLGTPLFRKFIPSPFELGYSVEYRVSVEQAEEFDERGGLILTCAPLLSSIFTREFVIVFIP